MKRNLGLVPALGTGLLALLLMAALSLNFMGQAPAAASNSTGAPVTAGGEGASSAAHLPAQPVAPQATPGQDFQDVLPSDPFYAYLHNLFQAGVVGGYTCGSADPCVPPDNLPYYHPGNAVTRLQMTKFIDLARRNIADAVGNSLNITTITTTQLSATDLKFSNATGNATNSSLYISTTAGIAVDAETRSGGEAVYAECLQANNNCYALEGYAPTGDYAGYLYGGKGVYAESDQAGYSGVSANAYGATAYGMSAVGAAYRGGYVKSDNTGYFSLYVDNQASPPQLGLISLDVNGSISGSGNLYISGSKAGYVVDIMQNADSVPLEPGEVVAIAGNGAPVLGQIPVVLVRKTTSAYDTGVVGVVDQVMYVPDAATKAAYDRQEAALRQAMDQRNQATAAARASGAKPDFSSIEMPNATISDDQGTLHADTSATQVLPNGYLSAVTLGSYKAVKVDASFSPIHAGDLLVASTHAGYAMKGADRSLASGATIGKALGNLETGTGLIPVMVTLK